MQDGKTRKIALAEAPRDGRAYFERVQVSLVTLTGTTAGNEYPLDRATLVVGRGPGVDLAFADNTMSREHAAFELVEEGFRVRDLASTNGVRVNDQPCLVRDLAHGDRIQIGDHCFQIVIEKRNHTPRTYVLSDET